MMAGVLLFGRFNPLQSAWPIFNRTPNEMTRTLDELARSNGGVLSVEGLAGAVANGLGYKSVGHVTAVPKLDFWRKQFPDMPAPEFNQIFNRYSHIIPTASNAPRLLQNDAVMVPVSLFQMPEQTRYIPLPIPTLPLEGHVDSVSIESGVLVVMGWAAWAGPSGSHALEVAMSDPAPGQPVRSLAIRNDLPPATGQKVSALNGFSLRIPLSAGKVFPALCVVAHDTTTGKRTLLHNPPDVPYCQSVQ